MISKKAEDLILLFEGFDVPWRWPGESSGITIGRGYDLGYEPFTRDWNGLLSASDFERLRKTVGLVGNNAARVAPSLRGINIPVAIADQVFGNVTLPRYEQQTLHAFPNSDKLPEDAFGALVSIVFNRGAALAGDRRREMLAIHKLLLNSDPKSPDTLKQIAALVRSMARLWPDRKDSDNDLHDRRMREAELIEGALGR